MIECASKGAVFLYTKELIVEGCASAGVGKVTAGFAAGAGAGVCQVVVMGPCTFLVTAAVTGGGQTSISSTISQTLRDKGLLGFYPGGLAIAFRQATNWASRQGLTDVVRSRMRTAIHSDPNAKLTSSQDALCGCLGGILSAWNHPFEVARIEMQARAIAGQESLSMMGVFREVIEQYGVRGLFQGILPRMGLSMWQVGNLPLERTLSLDPSLLTWLADVADALYGLRGDVH